MNTVPELHLPLSQPRLRLRRVRWYWLFASLSIFFTMYMFDNSLLGAVHATLVGTVLEVGGVVLFALALMFIISNEIDWRIAQIEVLEQERRRSALASAHLEAVGVTARSLAHQINQPLTVALASLQLLEIDEPSAAVQDELAVARNAVEEVSILIRCFQELTTYEVQPYAGGKPILILPKKENSSPRQLYV